MSGWHHIPICPGWIQNHLCISIFSDPLGSFSDWDWHFLLKYFSFISFFSLLLVQVFIPANLTYNEGLSTSPLAVWIHLAHYSEKAMASHSSTLAWKIPWMEEPGRLLSMGWHKVGHDWSELAAAAAAHYCQSHLPKMSFWFFSFLLKSLRGFVVVNNNSPIIFLHFGGLSFLSFLILHILSPFSLLLI